jgi:hypothetical protein
MQVKFEEFAVELSHKDSFLRRREQAMGLTGKKEKPRDKKVSRRAVPNPEAARPS